MNSTNQQNVSTNETLEMSAPGNTTGFTFIPTDFDRYVMVILPVTFVVMSVAGVIGNTMVLLAVIVWKHMRNPLNILIANLAIADLFFIAVVMPGMFGAWASLEWALGKLACQIRIYIVTTSTFVRVYTLTMMSILRYLAVVHPIRTIAFRTNSNARLSIIMIWTVVIIGLAPTFNVIGNDPETCFNLKHKGEEDAISKADDERLFYVVAVFLNFFCPVSVTVVIYGLLLKHLFSKEIQQVTQHSGSRKRKVTLMVVTAVGIFTLSWMPLQVMYVWKYFGNFPRTIPAQATWVAATILAFSNNCVNPVIYASISDRFRECFKKMMCVCTMSNRHASSTQPRQGHLNGVAKLAATTLKGVPQK